MQGFGLSRGDKFAYLTVRIIQATEDAGSRDAGMDTGRFPASQDIVQAKPALVGYSLFLVEDTGLIGTGYHAIFTADTEFFVDQYHPILASVGGLGGADSGTGGIGTMLALHGEEPAVFFVSFGEDADKALSFGEFVA